MICLFALAALGFRATATDPSDQAQVATVIDHHRDYGHSHDYGGKPSASSGHKHDRFHIGDHSHDTPTAAVLIGFRFASPRDQEPGSPDERIASRPTPPGDRSPRQA